MAVVKATSADVDLMARRSERKRKVKARRGCRLSATLELIGHGRIAQILKASAPSGR